MYCESDLEEEEPYYYQHETPATCNIQWQHAQTQQQCKTKKESTAEEIPHIDRNPPEEVIHDARGTAHQYGFVEEQNYPHVESRVKLELAQSSIIHNSREEESVKGAQGIAQLGEIDDEMFIEAARQSKENLKNASGTARSYQSVDDQHENCLERIEKVTSSRVVSKSRNFKEEPVEGDAIRKHKKLLSARGTDQKHELEGEVTEEHAHLCIANAETAIVLVMEIEKDKSECSTAVIKLDNDSLRSASQKKQVVVNLESTEPSPKVKKEMTTTPFNVGISDSFERQRPATVLYSAVVTKPGSSKTTLTNSGCPISGDRHNSTNRSGCSLIRRPANLFSLAVFIFVVLLIWFVFRK